MRISLIAALLTAPVPLVAQDLFENLDQLDQRVADSLAEIGAQPTPIDRRLHLARCPTSVTIDSLAMGAVAVRCPALGWRIRVRVDGTTQQADIRIRRGDSVALSVNGHGFQLRTSAIALEDGVLGGVVHVKSSTGMVTLAARVTGIGQADIDD